MAPPVEKLRFEGDADDLTRVLDDVTRKMAALAEQEGAVVKASAELSRVSDKFLQLEGAFVRTTKAGGQLTQRFKLTQALAAEVAKGNISIAEALKRSTTSFQVNTKAAESNAKALAAQAAAQAEQRRQFDTRVAVGDVLADRGPRRAAQPRATQQELLQLSAAEDNLKRLARTTKVTGDQIRSIFASVTRGEIRDFGEELNKVRNAVVRITNAEKQLGATAQKEHERAAKAAERQRKQINETTTATGQLIKAIKGLARVGAVSLFVGALFELQQAFRDGITAAAELSIKIAEIETIQGNAILSTQMWTEELRKLSDSFGLDILDQAEGAYQTLSTQIAKGTDAISFLNTANRLALAGVTDVGSAVRLTATLLNAYGLNASEAEDVSGKLFKTVELGVVRIEELSQGLGRISVPAAKLGIRFEELLAAVAQTTRQGVKFNESATLIRGIIQKTIKPTTDLQNILRELGFATGEAAIQSLGFGGFLAELDKRTQGSSTELGKLFNRVRAVTGGLVFAGQGVQEFNRTLGEIDISGVETLDKAAARIQASLGKRFDRVRERIKNFFLVDIGPPVLEVLLDITEGLIEVGKTLNNFVKAVSQSTPVVAALTAGLVLAAGALLKAFTPALLFANFQLTFFATVTIPSAVVALKALTVAFLATPVGALTAGLAAAAAAYVVFSNRAERSTKEARSFSQAVETNTATIIKNRKALDDLAAAEVLKGLRERNRATREVLAKENEAIEAANKRRLTALEDVRDLSEKTNKTLIDGLRKRVSAAGAEFKKFSGIVKGTAGDIRKSFLALTKDLFTFDISVAADRTQLKLVENQIANLQAQQEAAAAAGDKANFDRATSQLRALAKQRFGIIQRIGKAQRSADREIFEARADLIREQAKGDQNSIQAARDRVKDAERARRVVGTAGQEELDVQQQIIRIRRELSRVGFGTPEAAALRKELDGLRRLQFSINAETSKQEEQRKRLLTLFENERKLRDQLAKQAEEQAQAAFRRQAQQQLELSELIDLEKQRRDFNLEALVKKGDEEAITRETLKQLKVLERIRAIQDKLGASASQRQNLENEIALIQRTATAAAIKGENNIFVTRLNRFEEEQKVQLKTAQDIAAAQNKSDLERLNRIRGGLDTIAQQFGRLTREQIGRLQAETTEARGVGRATDLADSIKVLSATLQRVEQAPGAVPDLGPAAERIIEAIARQQVRGRIEGVERLEGDELLQVVSGELTKAGQRLAGEVGFLRAQIEAAKNAQQEGVRGATGARVELERALRARLAAEQAGALAISRSANQVLDEVQNRDQALRELQTRFEGEIKAFRERIENARKTSQQEKSFESIARKFSEGLDALNEDLRTLTFNKELLRLQNEVSAGADKLAGIEPGRQRLQEQLQVAGAKKAAEAQRPIQIETAKQMGAAQAQAVADKEREIADQRKKAEDESQKASESAKRQAESQRKIAEAGRGLTGFARRRAEIDERERQRKAGELPTGFALRKQEAEQRAAQRQRNAEFFRQRQAQKEEERQQIREREGPDVTAPLIAQTEALLKQAQARAPTDPLQQEAVVALTNQLKELRELQATQAQQTTPTTKPAFPGVLTQEELRLTEQAEARDMPLPLLEEDEPIHLLREALEKNTQATGELGQLFGQVRQQVSGFRQPQDPIDFTSQLIRPPVFRPEMPQFEDQATVDVTVPVDVKVELDGQEVASKVTKTVDTNLARRGRRGNARSNR